MIYYYPYETKIGRLYLAEEDGEMTHLIFCKSQDKEGEGENPDGKKTRALFGAPAEERETELLKKAFLQLQEYLSGTRKTFDLPLRPKGTEFQKKVWDALREIPYGQTRSYGEIAARIGKPKACRAVGMANNRNPLSVLIPCHRVVGAGGDLVGYGGGLPIKKMLLDLEHSAVRPSH